MKTPTRTPLIENVKYIIVQYKMYTLEVEWVTFKNNYDNTKNIFMYFLEIQPSRLSN